jgi:hypothetical protein
MFAMRGLYCLLILCSAVVDGATISSVLRRGVYIPKEDQYEIQTEPKVSPGGMDMSGESSAQQQPLQRQQPWQQRGPRRGPAAREEGTEDESADRPSKAIAFMLFMGIAIIAYVFAMTQTAAPGVAKNTIMVVDNICSIFVAVLWFSGVDELTRLCPPGHHRVAAATLHAVLLLSIAFAIAWALRAKSANLAWFCGCAAHFCAFASVHAGGTAQEEHFSWSFAACVWGLVAVFTALCVIGFLLYVAKKSLGLSPGVESEDESANAFVDRFDDVEQDFGGVCMAAYWTMVMRFAIVGRYPEHEEIEPGDEVDHTMHDRNMMLLYVFVMAGAAVSFLWFKSKMAEPSYPVGRCLGLIQSFTCVSVAFGFLFWGKMFFYEAPYFNVIPLMARLYFAGLCTFIAMIGIFVLSGIRLSENSNRLVVATATLGLVAGVAWEEVFDAAIEAEIEGSAHEATAKLLIAILASAVILPVHGIYLKPLALAAEEEPMEPMEEK